MNSDDLVELVARAIDPFAFMEPQPMVTADGKPMPKMDTDDLWREGRRENARRAAVRAILAVLQGVREPSEGQADKGEYINSEWLNDSAPIGQRRYREPARAVYTNMIDTRIAEFTATPATEADHADPA